MYIICWKGGKKESGHICPDHLRWEEALEVENVILIGSFWTLQQYNVLFNILCFSSIHRSQLDWLCTHTTKTWSFATKFLKSKSLMIILCFHLHLFLVQYAWTHTWELFGDVGGTDVQIKGKNKDYGSQRQIIWQSV